jgi:hypothetical protein
LLERLSQVRKPLEGTKFAFRESNDCIETVCPWGNRINVHAPDESRFGRIVLGMPYIVFDVRPGTAERIARFYREVVGALAGTVEDADGRSTRVQVGEKQYWYFRETDSPEQPYDRHHAQIYIADFSGPWRRLKELGLLTLEVNDHEYRFKDVIDLETREVLFTVEHEVRSQTHPMFGRPLVNRNPAQSNRNYKPGYDAISWAMPQHLSEYSAFLRTLRASFSSRRLRCVLDRRIGIFAEPEQQHAGQSEGDLVDHEDLQIGVEGVEGTPAQRRAHAAADIEQHEHQAAPCGTRSGSRR